MNDEQLMYELRLHAYDDSGEKDIPTHICNIAADRLQEMVETILDLEDKVRNLELDIDMLENDRL